MQTLMIIEHVLKFIIKPKNNDSQFTSPRHTQLHNVSNTNLRIFTFGCLQDYTVPYKLS